MYEVYGGRYTRTGLVLMVLEEAQAAYRLHEVDVVRGEHRGAEYRAINPAGYVPALVTPEGTTLHEAPDGRRIGELALGDLGHLLLGEGESGGHEGIIFPLLHRTAFGAPFPDPPAPLPGSPNRPLPAKHGSSAPDQPRRGLARVGAYGAAPPRLRWPQATRSGRPGSPAAPALPRRYDR